LNIGDTMPSASRLISTADLKTTTAIPQLRNDMSVLS